MPVYLDHNATTPLDPRVLEAMLPYFRNDFGNPSSVHRYGRAARAAIDQAREQVAELVNVSPAQVIFTSGGTEANNLALLGCAATLSDGRVAVSAVEHDSVIGAARVLAARGWGMDTIAVNSKGQVTADTLCAALQADTRLVSVMLANNETGVIQEIATLSAQVRATGAVFHCDAVQAAGKITVDFFALGVQLMSLSAHKFYGPKGVGALIVDRSVEIKPLLHGGGHEHGMRAGTENVSGIVGLGMAAQLARQESSARNAQLRILRDMLEQRLSRLLGVMIIAQDAARVPNTVQIGIAGFDGEAVLMQLDKAGYAVSSGSACASGSHEPSRILVAMGVDHDIARGAVRISLGHDNTQGDIEGFCVALEKVLQQRAAGAMRAAAML